ncbi:MAG: tripartite tricarboxylate transporter substrate-binding protein [Alphaproteobacteria bacterium]|jgi:tripartite-type tricarboxylate transporter receptor subunit TctC|nr:tripartite tricarboxylate transporter substrate-binding protein [Alphaproteobacteria bacterium]
MQRRAILSTPFLALPARAQAWPTRPVRVVVPFAAGGPVEIPTRIMAERLGQALGQPFLVEARPGAGGALGVQLVVRENDPHTLLVTTSSVAILPALMRDAGFDPLRDLTPITLVSDAPMALVARAGSPDLPTLLARARARPGSVSYASSGAGSTTHLAGALFAQRAGVELLHVPYRGAGQASGALLAGDTDMLVTGLIESVPHVREGRMVALGVTAPERVPQLPGVPALAEFVPGYSMRIWYAMLGPRGFPAALTERIVAALQPLREGSALATRMAESGAVLRLEGPAPLAARLAEEVPLWRELAARTGISA